MATTATPLSKHLEDHAATAALYADRSANPERSQYLDSNNKLSSAGAAASLKYAKPMDLPSFPSKGLKNDNSAAGAAASLGWQKKSPEAWKADSSSSAASKAAMLAKDYKVPPQWQPEQSTNGARAAVLAARDGGKVEIWKPEQSTWGTSAASQAFKGEKKPAPSPTLDYATAMGRKGSQMAASGAMSGTRRRSDSTPVRPTYPDEANASANALSAATTAHKPSKNSRTDYNPDAGSSPFTNMPKEMFTSHPPVAPEVDEKKRQNVLRASAVAMARQMYSVQQKQFEQAQANRSAQHSAAVSAHGRNRSELMTTDEVAPMRFTSLQEAAQKLAQERLAKLRSEHDQNREYRDYYGSSPQTSRLSIRNRVRQRASSDGTLDEDKEQSQKIRAQMSIFTNNVTQIDEKKRQKDRDALMAAAQRNVTASLKTMDEKAFKDTGKVQPSMLNEWEVKAHAAAQKSSESRMENYGKVNIGGGRFMDQTEVDAIAARNIQPLLDEINEKAEKQRAHDAEMKAEQQQRVREAEAKKVKDREVKEINKKLKEEQDKEEERERKKEEKAALAEQKRRAKEEKRKSKEVSSPKGKEKAVAVASTAAAAVVVDDVVEDKGEQKEAAADTAVSPVSPVNPVMEEEKKAETITEPDLATEPNTTTEPETTINPGLPTEPKPTVEPEPVAEPAYIAPTGLRTSMERDADARLEEVIQEGSSSPESPKSGVKSWLKKFRRSKETKTPTETKDKEVEKGFTGGAALTGASSTHTDPGDSSMKEVALAGKPELKAEPEAEPKGDLETKSDPEFKSEPAEEDTKVGKEAATVENANEDRLGRSKRRNSSVSSLSSASKHEVARDSTNEEFEEARDNFDDALAPPPTFTAAKSASPVRDSKFTEVI